MNFLHSKVSTIQIYPSLMVYTLYHSKFALSLLKFVTNLLYKFAVNIKIGIYVNLNAFRKVFHLHQKLSSIQRSANI